MWNILCVCLSCAAIPYYFGCVIRKVCKSILREKFDYEYSKWLCEVNGWLMELFSMARVAILWQYIVYTFENALVENINFVNSKESGIIAFFLEVSTIVWVDDFIGKKGMLIDEQLAVKFHRIISLASFL